MLPQAGRPRIPDDAVFSFEEESQPYISYL